jgi:hypothetical protein
MAKGRKTGGRKRGTPNKATAVRQAEIAGSGLTPLDYMLSVMRDEQADTATRLDAAVKAAPYVHPKLATIDNTHRGADGGPVQAVYVISDRPMTEEEWQKQFVREG